MSSSLYTHVKQAMVRHNVSANDTLIVAVSGGADSTVLLHCCNALGYRCVVAHVNYGLRGSESDADESFVTTYCAALDVRCEVLRVSDAHWQEHLGSTQEAARTIRYKWFAELIEQHAARFVVTAHHANDQTETMLYQFIRGGAGKSIYGMGEVAGNLLRPLLSTGKETILHYAKQHDILWRHDSSNDTDHYTRNRIRHHLIPLVESMNPAIHESIQQRSLWMHEEQRMVAHTTEQFLLMHLRNEYPAQLLSISLLKTTGFMRVLLWGWLHSKGFSPQQVAQLSENIALSAHAEPAWFSSSTHDVCVQNDIVSCSPKENTEAQHIAHLPWSNGSIHIDTCGRQEVELTTDASRQYLSADGCELPFTIRLWKDGDRLHPLGLSGSQRVSDLLTHAKVPAWKKKHVAVLTNEGGIAAVLGVRISDAFKITPRSTTCIRIQFSS